MTSPLTWSDVDARWPVAENKEPAERKRALRQRPGGVWMECTMERRERITTARLAGAHGGSDAEATTEEGLRL